MQWSAAPHGGFTTGVPWIETNPNYSSINAESSVGDDRSIWNHYRKLIALRKKLPVMAHGAFQSYLDQHPQVFVYTRTLDDQRIVVVASFAPDRVSLGLPDELRVRGEYLIGNYDERSLLGDNIDLQPYEAFAVLVRQHPAAE
jgi:oligo-1,6-glucosidase